MARRFLAWGLGLGLAVLAIAAALAVAAGSAYTSTSSFCTNCHEMSTRYVSWTRSTHARVDCMDCHSGVGLKGYVLAKIGGARQFLQHMRGNIGTITAVVEDPVCLKCHYFSKDPQYQYSVGFMSDPLYAPSKIHKQHFNDKDSTCTACHQGLVHGSLAGGTPIEKQVCEDCHVRKKIYGEISW